ncbi:carboxylesterase family protein [Pseudonocardia eucalypti]|uniref:Carboxylic ester hydrolase n=1 Tax=Pseudonocardia eucalypti TaxID=648755 RepID=A0ABP9QH72_9PSEU|nr:para-nitrobenzyl esterase [Pseudonocardia eucalypti]
MQPDPVAQTRAGAVRGVRHEYGEHYRAIPYAAAPVGRARFAAPAPHPGWSGVRDATQPSPTAPQPVREFAGLDMAPYFGPGWVPGEEYLTVNIHTPSAGDPALPVMVYVHGGGSVSGTGGAALYDGRAFARDGVVLVTLNYRIGIPGFLDLEGAPANRGLRDVLAALGWVRDNIAAFGGDRDNVTVFGQSAGATLIGALLATPEATGLFRRAIIQSGSGTGAFTPEQAQRVTSAASAALGVAPTADAFAAIPDDRLLEILPKLTGLDLRTETVADPLAGLSPFSLVLPRQPADSLTNGPAAEVDLLIGTNTEEGRLYLGPYDDLDNSTYADVLTTAAHIHLDPHAAVEALTARYPGASAGELRSALLGQALFEAGTKRLLEAHARLSGGHTHAYRFGYRSTAMRGRLGATHTIELPFVFDLADEPWLHGPTGLLGPQAPPPYLAAQVHGAWVAFAHTGNPGWSAHRAGSPTVRHFGPCP